LHKNKDPKNIPCHRVVFKDVFLSSKDPFGRKGVQKKKLKKEKLLNKN